MGVLAYTNTDTGAKGILEGEIIQLPKGNILVTECSGEFKAVHLTAGCTLEFPQAIQSFKVKTRHILDFGPAPSVIPPRRGKRR